MTGPALGRFSGKICAAGALLAAMTAAGASAAPPRGGRPGLLNLNSPEAFIEFRGEDDRSKQSLGATSVVSTGRLYQERLRADLSGNIYDERFLGFSLGTGFTLAQRKGSFSQDRVLRSLDSEYQGRIQLFPKHALSSSMFAERAQSTAFNVFAGQTRFERTQLRAGLALTEGPLPMTLSSWESHLTGGGFSQPFDQRTRGLDWMGVTRPLKSFTATLKHSVERFRDPRSTGYDYDASSVMLEGSPGERHGLRSQTRYEYRKGTISMRLFGTDAAWNFRGDRLRSDARYGYEEKTSAGQRTVRQSVAGRGEHRLYDSLTSGLGLDAEWIRETASRSNSQRVQVQEDYIKRLWGPLRFAAHFDWNMRLSQSRFDALLNTVLDEVHVLRDGSPSYLQQLSVAPETVSILSEDKMQRFREGIDYELLPQGALLEVRRIVTGSIANGDAVLISYQNTLSGMRRTKDTAQGLRFSLLLGPRGSFFVSERRQNQRIVEATQLSLIPNLESFREQSWGGDLRWKYFNTSQVWRLRESNISPLRSYSSSVKIGGEIFPGGNLVAGWGYDDARFARSGEKTVARDYFVESRLTPTTHLEFRAEGRLGNSSAAGTRAKYRMMLGQLSWSYRSVELEMSDRFTRRWVSNSYSEENILQVRILRRL